VGVPKNHNICVTAMSTNFAVRLAVPTIISTNIMEPPIGIKGLVAGNKSIDWDCFQIELTIR
jgi:hypothetical protein